MSPLRPSNPSLTLGAALCCATLALLCVCCSKAPDPSPPSPSPSQGAFGPQAPADDAVLPKLRPCMEVGRVFARMPPDDRLDAVVEGCAPILRPPCAAALRAQLDLPTSPPDTAAPSPSTPSPTAQLISACAAAYCPDLLVAADPPPLCSPHASPKAHRSSAQIAFLTAALALDFPSQAQGLDLLAGILISALPTPKPPTDPPPSPPLD